MTDEILEGVLDEFKKLSEIPRPSKHEEKVSSYLHQTLTTFGFDVTQDQFKNIIAEVPASEGKENAPLTILQAHMDMVCVAEDGYNFDALTDSIKLVRDEKFLTAEGTSLGADDGIGIAEILFITKNFFEGKFENIPHGPLRLIFTSDEEQGMSGALNIHKEHFDDAKFLINCDSENFDDIVVGSAGNFRVDFTREIEFVDAENLLSFKIKVGGLRGGHSGIEIADNRANAIKVLAKVLREMKLRGMVRLANIFGGTAMNVIPSTADATILTNLNFDDVKKICDEVAAQVKKIFIGEVNLTIDVETVDAPEKVFSGDDFKSLIDLLTLTHSGVYEMSGTSPQFVIASSNLGMIRTDDKITVQVMPRFNINELANELENVNKTLAKLTDFDVKFESYSPAWNFKPDGKLSKIAAEVFQRQNNFPAQVKIIHAGLECSHFIEKNPALDIISIGTTNEFIHSTQERLHLDTVTPQVNLIVETLKEISILSN
ncbi:MAG: beta-Ala-His dipeptidase [Selenomonadaceae bacterium]|nr:beta-Ala-His dipeptidase [Selenomonadaceae bacterium]